MKMGKNTVIKVGKGLERVKEKGWSKELNCQAAIKCQSTMCSDVRVNVIYTLVTVIGCFLMVAQLLPLRDADTSRFWWTDVSRSDSLQNPLSEAFLHEKLNTTTVDLSHGQVRIFKPHGLATHLYIEMSAYRGGPRNFSIVGLADKAVTTFHYPVYGCEWVSKSHPEGIKGNASKILPDWGYGKLYTVVVVTCKFDEDVGVDKDGGELVLHASYGDQYRNPERIVVLCESKGAYNADLFNPPYPYDYVYCGSPVYGDLSPQRMREWMAYHNKFFGNRTHYILYDSGGFHADVRKVLDPWVKQGMVTIQNIQQQEIYDGYYHNQFMVVNDCLFKSRFMAPWTFFFDIDEYMYVIPTTSLAEVLRDVEKENVTQITVEQVPMSSELCLAPDNSTDSDGLTSKWGLEKLVYRRVLKRGIRHDRKYIVQARHAEATGVHMSMDMRKGKNMYPKGDKIRYFHYHGTINKREEVCRTFVDPRNRTAVQRLRGQYHRIDETMAAMVEPVKKFELEKVGQLPTIV